MQPERPRARRYSFEADIQLIDVQSDATVHEQTSDLSLFGCHVNTRKPLAVRTRLRIRIAYKGAIFTALAGSPMLGRMARWELSSRVLNKAMSGP